MKTSTTPSLHFSQKQDTASMALQGQSLYLKAILSGKLLMARSEKKFEATNPDREAAIRYIKESKQSNKY